MGRVIVVGAVNVDLVMRLPKLPAPGESVLGGALARHDGGKGANQAVAAARAGASVHLIGAVGAADGADSVAALTAEGVNVAAVAYLAGPTGHAFVLVEDGSGENQIAVAAGANALVSADHVSGSLDALQLTTADVVVLSFELPTAALRAAARAAAGAGTRLVVNPGPALPRSLDLLDGAIATPNVHELAALAGSSGKASGQPRADALALSRRSGAPVIVTLGPRGALLADGAAAEHFAGHQVAVRDTTGAGDTFTGVLAASLAAGHDLRASVRRAVAASALAVTRDGARAGMPTTAQISALLARR
jgi:ribokinase